MTSSLKGLTTRLWSALRHSSVAGAVTLGLFTALPVNAATAERPAVQPIEVAARSIDAFKIGSMENRFGRFEFVSGLELSSSADDFGALSAFRFLDPGSNFVGVADTGFWFYGSVARTAAGKPAGFSSFRMVQMTDKAGKPINTKWNVDAEGLAVRDGEAYVGFERQHRISRFKLQPGDRTTAAGQVDFLVPANELRQNRGFEAVTFAPKDGPNQGALVVVSEKSLDKKGNIFAAVTSGPRKGIFTIQRSDTFDITDGAFLPNGDLLLLERAFSIATGVGMRLHEIPAEMVKGGAVAVDGPILLQADMGYQIDNMEAMDIWTRADGATMVSLMSDDNHSMLQRNLYLEFVLHDE